MFERECLLWCGFSASPVLGQLVLDYFPAPVDGAHLGGIQFFHAVVGRGRGFGVLFGPVYFAQLFHGVLH